MCVCVCVLFFSHCFILVIFILFFFCSVSPHITARIHIHNEYDFFFEPFTAGRDERSLISTSEIVYMYTILDAIRYAGRAHTSATTTERNGTAMGGGSTICQSHVSTFVCNTQIRFDFQWLPPARATYSGGEKNGGDDCIIIVRTAQGLIHYYAYNIRSIPMVSVQYSMYIASTTCHYKYTRKQIL